MRKLLQYFSRTFPRTFPRTFAAQQWYRSATIISLLMIILCQSSTTMANADQYKHPNILIILADDLGYSDIGAFGSEIVTPNIDSLAIEGKVLTNFHTTPLCATSRAELLTGMDHHLINVGTLMGHNVLYPSDTPNYTGILGHATPTIAQVLQSVGYHTYISGKWHLGGGGPPQYGFEQSFSLDPNAGSGSHFAQDAKSYFENGQQVSIPPDFFSSNYFVDKLIQYINDDHDDNQPFFAYLSFQAPHYPIQAPDAYLQLYTGQYDKGYDAVRAARIEKQKRLGIIPQDFKPSIDPNSETVVAPYVRFGQPGIMVNKPWDKLTPEQQRSEARIMEVFAGMMTNLDDNVGRVLNYLKQIGEYDNTFIIFTSDNGADGAGTIPFDHSNNNISIDQYGRPGSFLFRSARWAEVGNAPFRLFKTFTTEGGISAPTIVRLPRGKTGQQQLMNNATSSDVLSSLRDIAPTIIALAGTPVPNFNFTNQTKINIVGRSLLPVLIGYQDAIYDHDDVIADEVDDMRYVRRGSWKMVRFANYLISQTIENQWQLYNMSNDRGETNDLANVHPEIVSMLKKDWQEYVEKVDVAQPIMPFLPPIDQ